MCYDIITCPRCGEWMSEFEWDDHECKTPALEKVPVEETQKTERVPEIAA